MLREVGNGLFALGWTAGWAGTAVARALVTGNHGVVNAWTPRWAEGLARGWNMRVRSVGAEHLDPSRTYVFMCNHQSHVDIVALFVGLPVVPGFLAKKELRRVPILGSAMEVGGHVFIDRQRRKLAFQAIEEAAEQVASGKSIVIFPEGTRGDGQHVYRFKKGGFHLAKRSGVPLVPVGIRGTSEVLPKHGGLIRGGDVEIHIGEPLEPDVVEALSLEGLMAKTRTAICVLSGMTPSDEAARET